MAGVSSKPVEELMPGDTITKLMVINQVAITDTAVTVTYIGGSVDTYARGGSINVNVPDAPAPSDPAAS